MNEKIPYTVSVNSSVCYNDAVRAFSEVVLLGVSLFYDVFTPAAAAA